MLNVSQNFHNSISTFPRTIAATVEFGMVDVAAQSNCTPSSNSIALVGGVAQATDSLTQTRKYMSEEQNYLLLDGSFYTPPKPTDNVSSDSIGWWSAAISDTNGNFALPYPELTLSFSLNRIKGNILALYNCYAVAPPGWITPKTTWTYDQPFSYTDTNRVEGNELALYNMLNGIIQEYPICGQSLNICGLGWRN